MATAQTTRTARAQLLEVVTLSQPSVDRELGVIRGVKILGFQSRNGRRYLREAVQRAIPLYEGRGVNVDHRKPEDRPGERSVRDHFGELRNVHIREDGLYGDLYYLKTHSEAEAIAERAERMSKQIGLSHDAAGETRRENGVTVVESIDEVISVDLVLYPATTEGLFESEGYRMPCDEYGKRTMQEQEGQPPAAGEGGGAPTEPPTTDSMTAAFIQEATDVLNSGGSMDDMKAQLLAMVAPEMQDQEGDEDKKKETFVTEQDSEEEKKKEDEGEVKESLQRLQRRLDAQEVLMESGIDRSHLTAAHVKLLHKQPDRESMVALVESWPPYFRSSRPDPGGSQRQAGGGAKRVDDYDALRKRLVPQK